MKLSKSTLRFISATILASCFWIVFFYLPPVTFSIMLAAILITILIKEWGNIFKETNIFHWLIMPFYPILPFALLIYMNHHDTYRILVYYLFLTVFSFDTSSYLTGIVIGRYKILPSISPGKTLEGCIGGFIGALIVFVFALWDDGINLSPTITLMLVFMICAIAFFGDAFESILKRRAGIKDSGNTLPGHGGFLDRFDAVVMVAYFFFIFKKYLIIWLTP